MIEKSFEVSHILEITESQTVTDMFLFCQTKLDTNVMIDFYEI
jgi:hypothetical protein